MTDRAKSTSEAFLVTATENSTARTEAPTLTAGRALDILIAEKVMGGESREYFRNREPYDHLCRGECFYSDHSLAGTEMAPWRRDKDPKPYSTDIAAAWLVVEKMREKGWRFTLNDRYGEEESPFWAEFADWEYDHGAEKWSASMPEAICLAALSVLSQTEEGK